MLSDDNFVTMLFSALPLLSQYALHAGEYVLIVRALAYANIFGADKLRN